jgi:hypothetical protein
MTRVKINITEVVTIACLVIIGLVFRLKGISLNHSFWADEALVSSFSRDIVQAKTGLIEGVLAVGYQRLQTLTVTASFIIFGISEWSARLPSVIWGSVGIIFAYLVAKKYSNKWAGFLSAFVYALLQLNLAHATQAKPYAAIETLFLMAIYYAETSMVSAVVIAIIATLYNYIGIIAFIPIIAQILPRLKSVRFTPLILVSSFVGIFLIGWLLNINTMFGLILYPQYNWTTYLRELFWRQFGFISLPAIFGLFLIKDKKAFWGILIGIIALLVSWNFIFYSRNLRYLMPIFGLLPVLFGIFWGRVGEALFRKPAIVCLSVMALLFAGGYKIVRKPAVYYTPNADFFADVQNADYKTFFKLTYEKFPAFDSYPVFSNLIDSFTWYAHKNPTTLFKIGSLPPYTELLSGIVVYPDLKYFLVEMKKYPQGFVVVEDWQSILPEDIKEYVKKNLKLELRVESLSVAPQEKWPLELYTWGFE